MSEVSEVAWEFPPCPICGARVTGIDAETKLRERFFDGVGEVGDPRRFTISPAREMVPGDETITYSPCGHSEVKRA